MKAILAFLVAILAITSVMPTVFAAAPIVDLEIVHVNGLKVNPGARNNVAVIAGETARVTVSFKALRNAADVEISAWIQGEDRTELEIEDLKWNRDYRETLKVLIPEDIDMDEEKAIPLYIRVEANRGDTVEEKYYVYVQRQAHNLDFLLVDMDKTAQAGDTVPVTVVLKNMGRHEAEDTLVTVRMPELGIVDKAYFGDLYPADNWEDDDDEDARERVIFVKLPENVQAGQYKVTVIAETDDEKSAVFKNLTVTETGTEGDGYANPQSRTFAVGQEVVYKLELVNTGDEIAVYTLVPRANDALSIALSDNLVTIPAGSSKTVEVYVTANREGTFGFAIDAQSADGYTESVNYNATVEGKSMIGGNNVVALTIVLAIIFIVLIVILAVLLTRKPEKSEEFGESYY